MSVTAARAAPPMSASPKHSVALLHRPGSPCSPHDQIGEQENGGGQQRSGRLGHAAEELERHHGRQADGRQERRSTCKQQHEEQQPRDEREHVVSRPGQPPDHEEAEAVGQPGQERPPEAHAQSPREQVRAERRGEQLHHGGHRKRGPERQHVGGQAEWREDRRLRRRQEGAAAHDVRVPQRYVRQLGTRVLQEHLELDGRVRLLVVEPQRGHALGSRPGPRREAPERVRAGQRPARKQALTDEQHRQDGVDGRRGHSGMGSRTRHPPPRRTGRPGGSRGVRT